MKYSKNKITSIFLITYFLISCKDNSFDAKSLAAEYCNCMEQNHANMDYYNARIICDSKMNLKNRYFKMYSIEVFYGTYMGTFDKSTKDSVYKFNHSLEEYTNEYCPYIYKSDSIKAEYLKRQKY